jgi:hypothetical protein
VQLCPPRRYAQRITGMERLGFADHRERDQVAKAVLIVHSRPVEASREDEFNKWYDEVHIPDVTSVAGVVSGRRFKKAAGADDGGYPYLAIYELDTEDVGATMKELVDRTADGTFVMSEAFVSEGAFTGLFEPV